jgi:3-isopropylmalate/(R)-2-methylmalate dehydratase large subunit
LSVDPPRTLFAKIWDAHVVARHASGQELIYIDRHFAHEGSFHAFKKLASLGRPVLRPRQTFGIADHYVPTSPRPARIGDPQIGSMIEQLTDNCRRHGIQLFGLDDPRQGIVHVVGPELGLTLPGLTIVCGDSHTSTHGALGAFAFGIGASEVAQVLAAQSLWQKRPRTMRVRIDGRLGPGVTAKDVILAVIGVVGARGGTGHVIEYAGEAVRALSIPGRLTLCNMSIEAGARAGMVAPDETTLAFLEGRPMAPEGNEFAKAAEAWLGLRSDLEAAFDKEVALDGSGIEPQVTWGTSPEQTLPIGGRVPDPSSITDPG